MSEGDYLTPVEAAALKGVAYRTVLRAIEAGEFARVIKLGTKHNAHYAIHRADLDKWTPRPYTRRKAK